MNIDKFRNSSYNGKNGSQKNGKIPATTDVSGQEGDNSTSGKKMDQRYNMNKCDEIFAKGEMKKLNELSFKKVKIMKSKISEYYAAGSISEEAARETEIGKLLNDPDVWENIANKILA